MWIITSHARLILIKISLVMEATYAFKFFIFYKAMTSYEADLTAIQLEVIAS